jgi:hypothetical protein
VVYSVVFGEMPSMTLRRGQIGAIAFFRKCIVGDRRCVAAFSAQRVRWILPRSKALRFFTLASDDDRPTPPTGSGTFPIWQRGSSGFDNCGLAVSPLSGLTILGEAEVTRAPRNRRG